MSLLSKLTDPMFAGSTRARQRSFLEAAMAGAALAAAADGPVSLAERHVLDQVLASVDGLRAVKVHEAVAVFDGYVDAIKDDPAGARGKVLKAVAALSGDAALAPLLLRIASALARADGASPTPVQEEVAAIAAALGLPPPATGGAVFLDSRPEGEAAAAETVTIVLGNEKGGTGKSTTAMHLAVALLKLGHRVASIDLDGRQGTLSRYVAHRADHAARGGNALSLPRHSCIAESDARDRDEGLAQDKDRLRRAFAEAADCRFTVIDTPGSNSHLSQLAHAHADVLITPLNDSFLDVDALASIDRERREVQGPSPYSEMVWAQSARRVAAGRPAIDWVVMRNRLAHIDARNSREMSGLLTQLAERLRFRLIPGFGERVVFRELFYRGLTLFDLSEDGLETRVGAYRVPASHVHARQEVHELVSALGIAELGLGKQKKSGAGS